MISPMRHWKLQPAFDGGRAITVGIGPPIDGISIRGVVARRRLCCRNCRSSELLGAMMMRALWRVPIGTSALDNATLWPACRKPPLTPVLYFDAIFRASPLPERAPGVDPQALCSGPGGFFFGNAGRPGKTAAYQGPMPLHQRAIVVCNAAPLVFDVSPARPRPPTPPMRPERP